jgi:hypothetical protein
MDIAAPLEAIEKSGLATRIRDAVWLFPLIESAHVFAFSLVVGTIAILDFRLLGVASTRRSFHRMAADTLKWTWAAFALAALTGALMFITNARIYYGNFFFRTKMLLLVLAGVNVLIFELTAGRTIRHWDNAPSAPLPGKAAAAVSLAIWISIICMGRLIGFTTRPGVETPPPSGINFDDFLKATPSSGDGTATVPLNSKSGVGVETSRETKKKRQKDGGE